MCVCVQAYACVNGWNSRDDRNENVRERERASVACIYVVCMYLVITSELGGWGVGGHHR